MRKIASLMFVLTAATAFAGGVPDRIVIYLLDPRLVEVTDDSMPIEWKKIRTDVLGTRKLNATESTKLTKLLRKELVDDDNTPFCGHSPAYAVTILREGRSPATVTLCGTCRTWARNGELRVLHGDAALEYLDKLLPLPDIFRPVGGKAAPILDSFEPRRRRPFHELTQSEGEK